MKNKNNILILLLFCIVSLGLHAQQDFIPKQPKKRQFFFYPYTHPPVVIKNKISLFPNPANDFVEIKVENVNSNPYELEVISLKGESILQKEWKGERIDLSSFNSGIYLLRLSRDEEIYLEKLLIKK